MPQGQLVTRTLAANVTAVEASAWIDVSDLIDINCYVVQRVDNGTVTLQLEETPDGTLVVPVGATVADTAFAAGADQSEPPVPLESTNGMPRLARALRLNATAHTGTGEYDLVVTGQKRASY